MSKQRNKILGIATGIALLLVSGVGSAAQFNFFVAVDVSSAHPDLESMTVLCRIFSEGPMSNENEVGRGSTLIPMGQTEAFRDRVSVGVDMMPERNAQEVRQYTCTLYIAGGNLPGLQMFTQQPTAAAFQRAASDTELVNVVTGSVSKEAPRVKTGILRATGIGTPPPSDYTLVVPTTVSDAHPEISSLVVLCRLYTPGTRSNSNQLGIGSRKLLMPLNGQFSANVSVVAKVSDGKDPSGVGQYDCTLYIKNKAVRGITTFSDNPKVEAYRRTDPASRLVSVVSGALKFETRPVTTGRLHAKGIYPRRDRKK
ncbi:MAG: hypothetical protein ABGY42_03265 [bacterium]